MASRKSFRKPNKKRKLKAEINVVPYIDVMLVLLVIFMVTAPLLSQGVKIELPQADAKEMPAPELEPLVISLDEQGLISLNMGSEKGEVFDEQAVLKKVKGLLETVDEQGGNVQKREVYIQADRDTRYEKVMTLMAGLQSVDVEGVGLLVEPVPN